MNKIVRIAILAVIILSLFYCYFIKFKDKTSIFSSKKKHDAQEIKNNGATKPQIALIFDDLGESLQNLKEIHSLDIPVSISIIPGLKFSKNIAYIAQRCNFSVLIHLPLEPRREERYRTDKYTFIGSSFPKRKIDKFLRYYLNYIRIAVGANVHMGSKATENRSLMAIVLGALKQRGLVFVDSRTTPTSCAYDLAKEMGLVTGYNEGFLDSYDDKDKIKKRAYELIEIARDKKKIIVIAHPKRNTLDFLKEEIPALKDKVSFITIEEYFGL